MDELDDVLFTRVRKTVINMRPDHPWSPMENIDILKSSGMYLKDQITGKQGITLAGICTREYLGYTMRSKFSLNYILAFSSRTNLPKANKTQVEGFDMSLPPFEVYSIEYAKLLLSTCSEIDVLCRMLCSGIDSTCNFADQGTRDGNLTFI